MRDSHHRLDADWYDYPQFYDLAFRSETRLEADFIEAACRKYCPRPARRLLEPACGTGRLVTELAARGYRMTGFDLSRPALSYLERRLARRKLRAATFQADMADFRLAAPADAAFCTFDSFRHLLSERAARRHLECVAASLRPGGIYILGFHLLPLDASEECTERWTERRGRTQVTVTLRVLGHRSPPPHRATPRQPPGAHGRKGTPLASRFPVSHVHGRPVSPLAPTSPVAGTVRRVRLLV